MCHICIIYISFLFIQNLFNKKNYKKK